MLASSVYHTYNSMGRDIYKRLLNIDLVGIGAKIGGLAMSLIYTGFHNYKGWGNAITLILGGMMFLNLAL